MEIGYALYILIGSLGLVFGSFAGATVWRLRARQLTYEKRLLGTLRVKAKTNDGLTEYEAAELSYLEENKKATAAELQHLAPVANVTTKDDRSHCLQCHHVLRWYDLIPLVSWASTGGRCRYCKKSIGWYEPLMELGTAALFVAFAVMWLGTFGLQGMSLLLLGLWLSALLLLIILFVYDLKWFLLPDVIMVPLISLSAVINILTMIGLKGYDTWQMIGSTMGAIAILSGLYFVLWAISKGRWVGFGDVKLGLALGLLLMNWQLGLLTLLLANLIGTLIVLPGLAMKKLTRKSQVPFGPLLIVGFIISVLYGPVILRAYDDASMWLSMTMLML